MTYPAQIRKQFIKLRAQGKTYPAISEQLGVSRSTLQDWNALYSAQIEKDRAAEIEELYDEFHRRQRWEAIIRQITEVEDSDVDEVHSKCLNSTTAGQFPVQNGANV